MHGQYLYIFTTNRKIFIRDLSKSSTEKECSYGNNNKKLGWFLKESNSYNNGSPEINRAGNYLILYHWERSNINQRGFYKFNLTAGLNCPDETNDGFIQYSTSWIGYIKAMETK